MTQCEQHKDPSHLLVLQRIYRDHDGFIESVIRFCAKSQTDREDIYQEVYLVLYGKKDLERIQDVKSYLYRLVVNKSNEFLRSKITREQKRKQYIERFSMRVNETDESLSDVELRDEVEDLIDLIKQCLSARESQAILLRYKDYYDIDEAAEKMNVDRRTLIHYVSVGFKKLRVILKSMGRSE